MPFPWLHAKRTKLVDRRADAVLMIRREIEERSTLLRHLGYSAARTKQRMRQNLAWDFEVGKQKAPLSATEIDAIVDAIYKRGGPGAGAPSV